MKQPNLIFISVLLTLMFIFGSIGILLQPAIKPQVPQGRSIKVMAYNIHQGFDSLGILDLAPFVEAIKDSGADIVGLSESDTARITSGNIDAVGWLAKECNMNYYYGAPTRAHTYGVALLSKFPIIDPKVHYLTSEEDQRILVEVTVEVDGTPVSIFVVHMGLIPSDRKTQATEILEIVRKSTNPKIVMGDFNTCPDGQCPEDPRSDAIYDQITAELTDSWTGAGHTRNSTEGFTWESKNPDQRIDYIFVSNDITVDDCSVLTDAPGSDHLPVLAGLTI